MKELSVIVLVILILQVHGLSQHIEVLRGAKIQLNGNIYDFYESEKFFKEVPITYQKYQQAQRAKGASKVLGYTSLASLGIGIGLLSLPGQENCPGILCLSTGQAIGLFSVLVVFPVTGIGGIISNANYKSRFRKAAEFYNSNRDLIFIPDKKKVEISIGLADNGFGIVVNF